ELFETCGPLVEHVARTVDETFAEGAVGDDEDADHTEILNLRPFQGIEHHACNVEAGLLRDLLEAGRAGDVHLGQVVADDVEADQRKAFRIQHWSERLRDCAIARRERTRYAGSAGSKVAAGL